MTEDHGETSGAVENVPESPDTWEAMERMAAQILEPVLCEVGDLKITYGFCCPKRAKLVKKWGTYQKGDQHVGHETNTRGNQICPRGGFAVDISTPSSAATAAFIIANLPWDRIYYYGDHRALHVSVAALDRAPARALVNMLGYPGRRPTTVKDPAEFIRGIIGGE